MIISLRAVNVVPSLVPVYSVHSSAADQLHLQEYSEVEVFSVYFLAFCLLCLKTNKTKPQSITAELKVL